MRHPFHDNTIHDVCLKTFLTMDRAIVAFWILLCVGLGMAGTGIGWALNQTEKITILQQGYLDDKNKLDYLSREINSKLDRLIAENKRKGE